MCWLDWVMSCFDEAETNIDNTFVDDLDIRGSSGPRSVNKIGTTECGAWLRDHPSLRETCNVEYENIDERGSFFEDEDDIFADDEDDIFADDEDDDIFG